MTDDLQSEQRAQRAEVLKDADLLRQLIAHPGWPRYLALIEAVGQNFHQTAMKPLKNVFEVTEGEYAKGALNGLTLAATLPHSKIAEAETLRNPSNEGNDR